MFYVNFSINDGENISVVRVLSFVFKTCIRYGDQCFVCDNTHMFREVLYMTKEITYIILVGNRLFKFS